MNTTTLRIVSTKKIIISVLALLVLGILLGTLFLVAKETWPTSPPGETLVPPTLGGSLLVGIKDEKSVLYENTTLTERVSWEGDTAAVTNENESLFTVRHENEEWVLEREGAVVLRSAEQISPVSEAPSRGMLVYAKNSVDTDVDDSQNHSEASTAVELPSQTTQTNPDQWEVWLYNARIGTSTRLAAGYSPLFLDDARVVFFTSTGAYVYHLSDGSIVQMLKDPFLVMFGPILQSPDRSKILIRDYRTKKTSLYAVKDSRLEPVRILEEVLDSPALNNDSIFELVWKEEGTEVWRYGFDSSPAEQVYVFPAALNLNRIIF